MASGRIGGLMRGDHSEMSNCPLSPLPSLSMFLGSRQKVSAERGEGSRRWRKQEEAGSLRGKCGSGEVWSGWDVLKLLPGNP